MAGYIHSLESMGLVDGPGVRAVVFLQGCPLRCQYCHNPDTWTAGGDATTPQALVTRLLRFRTYFARGGGVTFSGGEPLLQSRFLLECLKLLKQNGIHTCIDTSGGCDGDFSEILTYTDLVLYDVKHHEPEGYRTITGGDIAITKRFVEQVRQSDTPMWVRHVVVPQLTDSDSHMEGLRDYVATLPNVQRVDLLPYHKLGATKYPPLGLPEPLPETPPMDKERCQTLQNTYFAQYRKDGTL